LLATRVLNSNRLFNPFLSITQKREDQNSPSLRSLSSQVSRLERQVAALQGLLERLVDEPKAKKASSSAFTCYTDDSLSDEGDREEATTEEMDEDDDDDDDDAEEGLAMEPSPQTAEGAPRRPRVLTKRASQVSAGSLLARIREDGEEEEVEGGATVKS
jgi:uncharacterized small protein (DUF1192 family)